MPNETLDEVKAARLVQTEPFCRFVLMTLLSVSVVLLYWNYTETQAVHSTIKADQEVQRKKWCEEEIAKNPNWKRPNWW